MEVKNLVTRFYTQDGVVHAVNDISYKLQEGEVLGVVGESGSGKSVHALSIMGLIPSPPGKIENGEIMFDGRDLLKISSEEMRKIRGARIGMIFQNPMTSLNPVMTIGSQITEVLKFHLGMNDNQAKDRAADLLDLVGIPDARRRLDDYPHEFSGGMRQRVMIAIGLSCNPQLLIADEPTTALDVTIQAQIVELMKELQEKLGMAIIWITHDLGVVAGIADTIQVMYGGKIVERGPVDTVFKDTRNAYTLGLLSSLPRMDKRSKERRLTQIVGQPPNMLFPPKGDPFAPRNPYATERCWEEMPPLKPVKDGHPDHIVAAWYDLREELAKKPLEEATLEALPPAERQGAEADIAETVASVQIKNGAQPLIRIRNLVKHFPITAGLFQRQVGAVKAVDDVSFDIYPGETLGLVGESGSGKSTTGRTLLQLHKPTSGSVEFEGREVTSMRRSDLRELRKRMQIIFQDPYASLSPRMTIANTIGEAFDIHGLYTGSEKIQHVVELLERVGLNAGYLRRYPHELSGGQNQRVGIARALALDPAFIVADEPISALDVSIQAQVVNLMQDLQRERGLAYLFIAHDLSMIRHICDRVAVMYRGKIVELADTDELYENPLHPYTQVLLSAVPIPDPAIEKTRERLIMDDTFDYGEAKSVLEEVKPGHYVAAGRA